MHKFIELYGQGAITQSEAVICLMQEACKVPPSSIAIEMTPEFLNLVNERFREADSRMVAGLEVDSELETRKYRAGAANWGEYFESQTSA